MKVGIIGLGIVGRPMAGHLADAGHELFVHDLAPVPAELLSKGAVACGSGREVAERAEVIITMVPDTPHVEAVLFGPGGIAEGLTPGKVVIDMSSILTVMQPTVERPAVTQPEEDMTSLGYVLRLMAGACDEPQPA